jgi:hypothetical protein
MKQKRLITTLVCVGVLALIAVVFLPALALSSNCGGNSFALAACKEILLYEQQAKDSTNGPLNLDRLGDADRSQLFQFVTSHWTTGAGYWFRTNHTDNLPPRHIVAVCDTVYANVPPPTLWNHYRKNPAHAVGYSDGTVGLISPAEFGGLDRQNFISLTAMATNVAPSVHQ